MLKCFMLPEPPGKVIDLKVTDSTYSTLLLGWTKPTEEEGVQDEAKGYFVEIRPAENPEWGRCNSTAIITTSYNIMGLKSMAMYWVRVLATNEGGDGEPQELNNYIIAMPPPGEMVQSVNFLQSKCCTFHFPFFIFPNCYSETSIHWQKDEELHCDESWELCSSQLQLSGSVQHSDRNLCSINVPTLLQCSTKWAGTHILASCLLLLAGVSGTGYQMAEGRSSRRQACEREQHRHIFTADDPHGRAPRHRDLHNHRQEPRWSGDHQCGDKSHR